MWSLFAVFVVVADLFLVSSMCKQTLIRFLFLLIAFPGVLLVSTESHNLRVVFSSKKSKEFPYPS